jgi:hypothetical protein
MLQKDTRNRVGSTQGDRVAKRNQPEVPGGHGAPPQADGDWIAGNLRKVREEALRDEIPERMRALLDQIDRLEKPEEDPP